MTTLFCQTDANCKKIMGVTGLYKCAQSASAKTFFWTGHLPTPKKLLPLTRLGCSRKFVCPSSFVHLAELVIETKTRYRMTEEIMDQSFKCLREFLCAMEITHLVVQAAHEDKGLGGRKLRTRMTSEKSCQNCTPAFSGHISRLLAERTHQK